MAAFAVAVALPSFLCAPLWADVTLYDLAARAVLRGGTHYRDVFDTNLPGMVWAHVAVRTLFGWSNEAIRAVDFAIVAGTVAVLAKWIRAAGASAAAVAWFAATVALFYPYLSEYCHCQRDVWMLLPAAVAAGMRVRRANGVPTSAFVEGLLWGSAVWIKPFVFVPAAAVWFASMPYLGGRREVALDALRSIAGGAIVGATGVAWLVGTGTWPHFVDVFANWNPEYAGRAWTELPDRVARSVGFFPPWALLHYPAIPLALSWLIRRNAVPAKRLLAAIYLGWMFQTILLQRGLDYVQVPGILLAIAVLAVPGTAIGVAAVGWFGVVAILVATVPSLPELPEPWGALEDPHPLARSATYQNWGDCLRRGSTPEIRDRLSHLGRAHCGTEWVDLDRVATFLRSVDPPLRDRELLCWHDATHPLYLMLDTEPAVRYMHVGTAIAFRSKRETIAREVVAARPRFVVADLRRVTWYFPVRGSEPGVPEWLPASEREKFPWNQPVVFRAGRYLVFAATEPFGEIDVPAWEDLGRINGEP